MLKKFKIIIILMITLMLIASNKIFANTVEYRGEVDGLIATPNDFFLNFDTLLPGDTMQDVAYIKNSTNDEIEVFFKTEPLDKSEYYDEIDYSLLEKIKLKITLKSTSTSEEKMLYEGNLGAELMSNYVSLGNYKKGYDGEFIFKIEVPTELRNDYTLSATKVKWVFAVEKDDKKGQDGENVTDTNEKKNPIENIINSIKTGDAIYYAVGALTLAILICIVVIVIKKRS